MLIKEHEIKKKYILTKEEFDEKHKEEVAKRKLERKLEGKIPEEPEEEKKEPEPDDKNTVRIKKMEELLNKDENSDED